MEILTLANAILGFGACSLAKYLMITSPDNGHSPDIYNVAEFFTFMLERIDWRRDLHFQTETTIDSLDYSGTGINQGSKVVIAACGEKKRDLAHTPPPDFSLPRGFANPRFALPGILVIEGPAFKDEASGSQDMETLATQPQLQRIPEGVAVIVVTEDSDFAARHPNNFLWVTFTRSNPSHDIYGVGSFTRNKHWGCKGPLLIDARQKPQHAPSLVEDPRVTARVDELGRKGGCLHGII